MEEWKDVVGFEGLYQVSNFGRVKTLGRIAEIRNRWGGAMLRKHRSKIMKLGSVNNPHRHYVTVGLRKNGAVTTYEVHRLVAAAFIGPMPKGECTCHKNGNSKDNRAENLRYDTQKANIEDKKLHGTYVEGETVAWAELANVQVAAMRMRYATGERADKLAAEFRTTENNVRRICRGERYASAGGPFTTRRGANRENRIN